MIRIGKMTDYSIVLLTHFAKAGEAEPTSVLNARDLSEVSRLPLPTVSKILKALCKEQILTSIRGTKGGYRLSRLPEEISVAQIIRCIEGPIALTDCSREAASSCDLEGSCPVRSNWQIISASVVKALSNLSLKDMTAPMPPLASAAAQQTRSLG